MRIPQLLLMAMSASMAMRASADPSDGVTARPSDASSPSLALRPVTPAPSGAASRATLARIAAQLHEHLPAFTAPTSSPGAAPHLSDEDGEIVKLPSFLVRAPKVQTPSENAVVEMPLPVVSAPDFAGLAKRDAKRRERMTYFLDLADLSEMSGDHETAQRIRRETYRALTRTLTPLENAMDRSANGGR
jgi:hypothetical protein